MLVPSPILPLISPSVPHFATPSADSFLLQYLDKRLFVQLNGSRKVIGVLRGYDVFLNIVLDEAVEEKDGGEKVKLGMVVCWQTTSAVPDTRLTKRIGHPRKLGGHARGTGEDRRRREATTGLRCQYWRGPRRSITEKKWKNDWAYWRLVHVQKRLAHPKHPPDMPTSFAVC